ncbi:MAG TPA: MinD/ParA family protein [Sediminispirochaeta sp.]|nr:MinD/ParA family protein [Sediminispirochaeta sp.]
MTNILPIAGGKGGVGKTLFAANLGIALAQAGKTCVLIDLDLGSSNLHTCLGIKNTNSGIGNYIYKQESSFDALLIPTEINRLFFVPGDSLLPGTANLPYFSKKKIIRDIQKLTADFVIIDLGAGSSYNVLDFFLTASSGLIVSTPETTSILSSYSFIKSTVYRLLTRSYPPKSIARQIVHDFFTKPIEGDSVTSDRLFQLLDGSETGTGETARRQLNSFFPRIVLNMGRSNRDFALGAKLRQISEKNLGVPMEYIGFLPKDERVAESIITRTPYILAEPDAPYCKAVQLTARKLISTQHHEIPRLFEGSDEDLEELKEQFYQHSTD